MKKSIFSIPVLFIILVVLSSCEKKRIGPQNCDDEIDLIGTDLVLIANEGNFGSSNASLSVYDPVTDQVENNVLVNNGLGILGDVFQSITQTEDAFYLILNNSSKIVKLDKETLDPIEELSLPSRSPRHLVKGNNGQLFVSNFAFQPNGEPVYLDVIDEASFTLINSINLASWSEEMLVMDARIYVCDMGSNTIRVIDDETHEEVATLEVGIEPISIVKDINHHMWVLCTGGFEEELASLWRIDPITNEMMTWTFGNLTDYPFDLKINGVGDKLFFLNDGVFNMDVLDLELPDSPIISPVEGENFYALDIDPNDNYIYVSDAVDFQSAGKVSRYNASGTIVSEFAVGINPGAFEFQ